MCLHYNHRVWIPRSHLKQDTVLNICNLSTGGRGWERQGASLEFIVQPV